MISPALIAAIASVGGATGAAAAAVGSPPDMVFGVTTGDQTEDYSSYFTGDSLTYSLTGEPSGVTINSSTGVVTVATDTSGTISADTITVVADNAFGPAASHDVLLDVIAAPATTGSPPDMSYDEDTGVQTQDYSSYFTGDFITYSLSGEPTGVTINSSTGVVSVNTASTGEVTADTITVTATNVKGSANFDVTLDVAAASSDIEPANFNNVVYLTNMNTTAADLSNESNSVSTGATMTTASESGAFLSSNRVARLNSAGDRIELSNVDTSFEMDGDFCFEGWFYPTGSIGGQFSAMFGSKNSTASGPDGSFALYRSHTNSNRMEIRIVQQDGSGFDVNTNLGTDSQMPEDEWYHVAMTRSGSTLRVFLDGVQVYSTTYSGTIHSDTPHDFFVGGVNSGSTQYFIGDIGPVRITKDEALYTSAFTRPANPFPTS